MARGHGPGDDRRMTMTPIDTAIEATADRQLGRFTRAQVRSCGPDGSSIITSRLRSGRWVRLTSKVLSLPGARRSWVGDLWTAHLHVGPDSVVSHRSAARLHGLPGVAPSTPCLTVPSGSNRKFGAGRLFQRGDLAPGQVVRIGGLTVTSVARTIVDLAPGSTARVLETWLDLATAERLVTPDELLAVMRLCGRRGKASLDVLEELVADYLPRSGSCAAELERSFRHVIKLAGLPPGVPQFRRPGVDGPAGLWDRAWLQPRLIIECDGRGPSERTIARRVDVRRDSQAAAEGWQTLRYPHERFVAAPVETATEIRRIYEQRMLHVLDLGTG